jgi:hypothetical protein
MEGCVALRAKIGPEKAHPIDEDLSMGTPDFGSNPPGWCQFPDFVVARC